MRFQWMSFSMENKNKQIWWPKIFWFLRETRKLVVADRAVADDRQYNIMQKKVLFASIWSLLARAELFSFLYLNIFFYFLIISLFMNESDSHGRAVNSPSKQGFHFLKLSEFKQWKSFVRIGRNFKAKMA